MTTAGKTYGPLSLQMEADSARVEIKSGAATTEVAFRVPFVRPPQMMVVGREADSGGYTASAITERGFTLNVTGSDLGDGEVRVAYVAIERS